MEQTLVEKIFSIKVGRSVTAGETIWAEVDLILGTDATAPLAIKVLEDYNIEEVCADKIVLVEDHFVPAKDINSCNLANRMKAFATQHGIGKYYGVGRNGICHVLLPELGVIKPNMLVTGADSHTCTYGAFGALAVGIGSTDMAFAMATGKLWFQVPKSIQIILEGERRKNVSAKDIILYLLKRIGMHGACYEAIEFGGRAIHDFTMSERLTICNMVSEMGAKCGLIPFDRVTDAYCKEHNITVNPNDILTADEHAVYQERIEIDLSVIEPMVACPNSPANVVEAKQLAGMKIDQVLIGSCTNGRTEDFQEVSRYLGEQNFSPDVRVLMIPGSRQVYLDIIRLGIAEQLIHAGAQICPPTCGPCVGGHMGVLGEREVGLFTTNRNFLGRSGDKTSQVYLCSPATATCSAIRGFITVPSVLERENENL